MINLDNMTTEKQNSKSSDLDTLSLKDILRLMNEEDATVANSVNLELENIEKAVLFVSDSFKKGGRLIYMGAGTSGRLGVLDAVECPPTFGTEPSMVVGLIAGGEKAFVRAVEGAEDDLTLAEKELIGINLTKDDTVIGIAASGRTPYVIGGFKYANSVGSKTVSITCNKNSETSKHANVAIEVVTGAEVLTGSTRLKAGTAQKIVLNMISTASMISIGKVYKNFMVDVKQSNKKLCVRAQNIVMEITSCTREVATEYLIISDGNAKIAIVMLLLNCDKDFAIKKLAVSGGHIRKAIN